MYNILNILISETRNSSEKESSDLIYCKSKDDFEFNINFDVERRIKTPCAAIKISTKMSFLLLSTYFVTAIL